MTFSSPTIFLSLWCNYMRDNKHLNIKNNRIKRPN